MVFFRLRYILQNRTILIGFRNTICSVIMSPDSPAMATTVLHNVKDPVSVRLHQSKEKTSL